MIRLVVLLGIFLFYSGCVLTNVSSETQDVKISKRVYKDISKDAILEATKKIFLVANDNFDNNEFVIDSYRNKVEISRVLFENKLIMVDLYLDKWIVEVYQFENETRVNLSLVRTDAKEQKKNISIPDNVYELFWSRLDYILGLNDEWTTCRKYYFLKGVDTTLCNNFFFSDMPKERDKIKDVYISQREKKNYTIDKIKTNIFENPSLTSTQDMEDIYTNSENIEELKLRRTIMEDQIFDVKEEKVEVTKESEPQDMADIAKSSSGEEKIKEEDINAFTKNINNIVNKKKQ